MSVNGKFSKITTGDILEVADRFGVGTARGVINQILEATESWQKYAELAGIPNDQVRHIQEYLRPIPAQ